MMGCKPVDTSMDPNTKLGVQTDGTTVGKGRYQRLVGKLIYLTHTRTDICFSVSIVSQFMNNRSEEHMEAVYQILQYLKRELGKGLLFRKMTNRTLEVFTDANWAGSTTNRRLT